MTAKRKVRISLTLSREVLSEIDRWAAVAKVSRSAFIEGALREYLQHRNNPSK
jgi:metal-responsive CopG/Arc/MetJ family transcriptional regulator